MQGNPYFGDLVDGIKARGVHSETGFLSIKGSLRGTRYDVIHTHFLHDSPLWCVDDLARLAWYRLLGSRIVKTCHNVKPHSTGHPWVAYLAEAIVNRVADHVIFFTDGQRQEFCEYYRFTPANSSIICHPYPDNYCSDVDRSAAREWLGLAVDDFVYLIFGLVRANKNYDAVIEAFQTQHAENDKLLVAIGPHRSNPSEIQAFERCKSLLERDERGIVSNLGYMPDEDVPRYFRAADVVIVPFTGTTSSTSFMLSVSFEIPFIAIGNSFNREVLPERCGLYIDTLGELSQAMLRIKACNLQVMQREIASRKPALSWERVISDHIDVYTKVLNGGS
jgi:glycosyltransferase involved in cell wall biosynthesis